MYNLKKNLTENGIFLCFNGPFSQGLMVEIGDILKQRLKAAHVDDPTILKVFSAMVEQSQNILHHSAEKLIETNTVDHEIMLGIIAVGSRDSQYFILGGNKIRNSEVEPLKEKLSQLSVMNKDELKSLYKEQRKTDPADPAKGAGLGLIDLARKSSQPIEFSFDKLDQDFSYFSIKTVI
jgi:hypothetical protein